MKKMKGSKKVSGKKYVAALEERDEKEGQKDNFPSKKPADIAQALSRSKMQKKILQVKPSKKK